MSTVSKPVGYESEFVGQVPEDYFCKQCKYVTRDPNLISCCGEVLCKGCVDRILQDRERCPSCGNMEFTTLPHVKYQRKILDLEVNCAMKGRGCQWTGQLQHLNAHLHGTNDDCQYVDVDCPKQCAQKVQKHNMEAHLADYCPNRDCRCHYCNFKDTFSVISDHFKVCPDYPLVCPNRCGVAFERGELDNHMKMCRLEEVLCEFSNAGCQVKFIREKRDEHMEQNTQKHLALMAATTLRTSQHLDQKIQEQQNHFEGKLQKQQQDFLYRQEVLEKKLQDRDEQIKSLLEELQTNKQILLQQQATVGEIRREVVIPLGYFTLSGYQQLMARREYFDSPPMCTHPNGYMFKLRMYPPVSSDYMGVRVFSHESDHDTQLQFPVTFIITLQLLNQHRDQDHYTKCIHCEIKRKEAIGSFIGVELTFLSRTVLEFNTDKQTLYLKDNCFKFRVSKVVLHTPPQ